MHGSDEQTGGLFGYVGCEARVPADHPLRLIRAVVDEAMDVLSSEFDRLYARVGWPGIAPAGMSHRAAAERSGVSAASAVHWMQALALVGTVDLLLGKPRSLYVRVLKTEAFQGRVQPEDLKC